MQRPSVDGRFVIIRCSSPTILAIRRCAFPLVGNAHRAFRGEKRVNMPFGWSTDKYKLTKKSHNKLFQPMQQMSVERTFRNLLLVYGRGRRRCGDPTILAIRCCAFSLVGNAHRAFRGKMHVQMPFGRSTGKHTIYGTNTQCNYFNPCNARPSNARIVFFCMFTVADAAGAATLRFKR